MPIIDQPHAIPVMGVNEALCAECGTCVEECPAGAISDLLNELRNAGAEAISIGGVRVVAGTVVGSPVPNPFRDVTRLALRLSEAGPFAVRLFDLAGREVRAWREAWSPAGARELLWDGRDASGRTVPAGVYLARVEAGGQRAVRRIVRLR